MFIQLKVALLYPENLSVLNIRSRLLQETAFSNTYRSLKGNISKFEKKQRRVKYIEKVRPEY